VINSIPQSILIGWDTYVSPSCLVQIINFGKIPQVNLILRDKRGADCIYATNAIPHKWLQLKYGSIVTFGMKNIM